MHFFPAKLSIFCLPPPLDEESYQGLMQEAQEKLQQFCTDGGGVIMPMDAFVISAEKS